MKKGLGQRQPARSIMRQLLAFFGWRQLRGGNGAGACRSAEGVAVWVCDKPRKRCCGAGIRPGTQKIQHHKPVPFGRFTPVHAPQKKNLLFSADLVRGRSARAVRGMFSDEEVLEQFLAGTGLEVEKTAAGALVLRRAGQQQQAVVAPPEQAAPSTPRPPRNRTRLPSKGRTAR